MNNDKLTLKAQEILQQAANTAIQNRNQAIEPDSHQVPSLGCQKAPIKTTQNLRKVSSLKAA
jgi:predicted neuraminidase